MTDELKYELANDLAYTLCGNGDDESEYSRCADEKQFLSIYNNILNKHKLTPDEAQSLMYQTMISITNVAAMIGYNDGYENG